IITRRLWSSPYSEHDYWAAYAAARARHIPSMITGRHALPLELAIFRASLSGGLGGRFEPHPGLRERRPARGGGPVSMLGLPDAIAGGRGRPAMASPVPYQRRQPAEAARKHARTIRGHSRRLR